MPGAPLHPLRSGRRHAAAQWKSKQKSKKYVWKLNDHAPKIKWFQDAKLSVCGRIFWTLCEIPTNLVKYLFLNVTLLLFLAPFHIFIFLFSSPHFLGDRLSMKFQRKSSWKLQKFDDVIWKFVKHCAKIRDEHLLNCWCRRGAKECKSDKPRQELSNEYLLAKFGYDTAENEPFNFHNFSSL